MKNTEESLAVQVPLCEAEKLRRYLIQHKLLRSDLEILHEQNAIYYPITKPLDETTYIQVKKIFKKRKKVHYSYKDLVNIPDDLKSQLPTSFDVIGDIALIKLDSDLVMYDEEIGNAMLACNKHLRVVAVSEPVSGIHRIRNIRVIAGEHRTQTDYVEFGLHFIVDIQNTFFSPRLASERKRIATLVQPGERILDMFAGVAPFSCVIARFAHPSIVYAVDINKTATELAKKNVIRNKLVNKIEVIHGDAHTITSECIGIVDRIIMNLPFLSAEFFPNALRVANTQCSIHYYTIVDDDIVDEKIKGLISIGNNLGFDITIDNVQRIKSYSPREFYICLDITARKYADVA